MLQAISTIRLPQLPERLGAGFLVAAVHAVLILGITVWAPGITRAIEAAPLQVQLLSVKEPEPEKWQPPSPQLMTMQPVVMAPPEVEVQIEPPPVTNAITLPRTTPPPPSNVSLGDAKVISEVAYLQPPSPRYPPESKRSREQGLVSLRVLIDEKGHAREVRIEQSSGFRRLDEAAREAVSRAIFRPYVEAGVAQPAIVIIPIEFALNTRNALARSGRS